MRYIIFILLILVGCKEIPEGQKALPEETGKKAEAPVEEVKKPVSISCEDDVTFLNVVGARYQVKETASGKDVTCTVITNTGLMVSHTENYPNALDPSFQYFSSCKVFHGGYEIRFVTPGYYDTSKEYPKADSVGWKIMNITNLAGSPADGYAFDKGTCDRE